MKSTFALNVFLVAVLSFALGFAAPVFGDADVDVLNQAQDLVHQALNPGGDPPSNAQRIDLLNQALKLLQQIPPDKSQYRGHRKKAVFDLRAALGELNQGDPNNKATDDIEDASAAIRDAISDAT
jgi:hypothetical protein